MGTKQKIDFVNKTRKNKAGEVSVIRHKSGFRALNVTGKVMIPLFFSNYPNVLHRIVTEVGALFLGLFPFLSSGKNKHIFTCSLPETVIRKKRRSSIELSYDFIYAISAVDISTNDIFEKVLNLNSIIGEQILNKLDKDVEEAYLDGG